MDATYHQPITSYNFGMETNNVKTTETNEEFQLYLHVSYVNYSRRAQLNDHLIYHPHHGAHSTLGLPSSRTWFSLALMRLAWLCSDSRHSLSSCISRRIEAWSSAPGRAGSRSASGSAGSDGSAGCGGRVRSGQIIYQTVTGHRLDQMDQVRQVIVT